MTMDDTNGLPTRPQQPPPTDVVQQQLRLLVQALNELKDAVSRTDRKHISSSGSSVGPTAARAGELVAQVAELGGWADSLMEVGTHVIDGDQEYIVGEPDRTAGSASPGAGTSNDRYRLAARVPEADPVLVTLRVTWAFGPLAACGLTQRGAC